jgi:hypothetical protein
MSWTIEEIEREWLGGERVSLSPEDVVRSFTIAEQIRGREWVLNTMSWGGGRQWGFAPFLRVYAFGTRIEAIIGAPGADTLIRRLLQDDRAADSELTAIYLLRSRCSESELEIGPEVTVGDRRRRPDFRIRRGTESWTYVETTQLNRSEASERTQEVLRRISSQVMSIPQPFILELMLWREPTEGEENALVKKVCEACQAVDGSRYDIGDLASLLVKSGNSAVVIPSIFPEDDGTRMSMSKSIVGPGQPNRQIVVRAPFADQRAETVLTAESKQLPRQEPGLVMVDVAAQPTAFESWAVLVPRRFTTMQHTRVGGVLLFMSATTITAEGIKWLPYLKLIPNPHASEPLRLWIVDVVEQTRAETRRLTGRPD